MLHQPRARWFALTAVIAVSWGARAQDVSGAGFYPFRGSARTIALAGAFTAVSDDTAGLHFNPAGMALLEERQGSATIKVNGGGENFYDLSYIEPVAKNKLGGGLSFSRASDNTGRSDKMYQLTYGQFLYEGLALGVTLRYHTIDTAAASESNFSFDLGALYTPPSQPDWTFGVAILDIPEPSFAGIGKVKRTWNLGAAYRPDKWTQMSLDWYDIGSQAKRGGVRFGAERQLTENIAVRGGVAEDVFGVGVSVMYKYFTLDYGFQRVDAGNDLNMLTLLANF